MYNSWLGKDNGTLLQMLLYSWMMIISLLFFGKEGEIQEEFSLLMKGLAELAPFF